MEPRGDETRTRAHNRPAIARRSCDQCRARKIGCDRGSPCSNCISARLICEHSVVASNAPSPKKRVLISAQYEQKIDAIARDVHGIKSLLQEVNVPVSRGQHEASPVLHFERVGLREPQSISTSSGELLWDHSAHILDFIKAVAEDRSSKYARPEMNQTVSSLKTLIRTLESPSGIRRSALHVVNMAKDQSDSAMPPLEAVVEVLRWTKEHKDSPRIACIFEVMTLQMFTNICQKVYFAVDDYSDVELILANGFLSYIFFERLFMTGKESYRDYCRLCRENLHSAVSRLPLFLPVSMEVIAALTIGAFNAIDNSKARMAWTLISAASDMCQTLGYHRLSFSKDNQQTQRSAQEPLFWVVYRLDKSLSLHLGRSSNICDTVITLLVEPDAPRSIRLARIQGKVYEQLYSPASLSRTSIERESIAGSLAGQLRKLIDEIRIEISQSASSSNADPSTEMIRVISLQSELICQSSLLTLTLRAAPIAQGPLGSTSDDCVVAARNTLDIHEQCMLNVRGCEKDPWIVTRYINWAIVYLPFVPFSILYTHAIQRLDVAELARLDRFAASLQPDDPSTESITHPYRLYTLLCQAARLYFESNTTSSLPDPALMPNLLDPISGFDFAQNRTETEGTLEKSFETGGTSESGLSDWYYANQQIMSLLDENAMY